MARSLLLIFLFWPLYAQFSQFSATDDGRRVYFTSTLQLADDSPGFGESRIFVLDENGVALFAASGRPSLQTSSGASAPQVSSDGKTVGLTRDGIGELVGAGATVLGPGVLAMSRNARWAALTVTSQAPPPTNALNIQSTVINLATGERTGFSFPQGTSGISMIASNGTAVVPSPSGPSLWRQGNLTPVTLPDRSTIVALSDDASLIIYEQIVTPTALRPQERLIARNLATGNETTIVTAEAPYPAASAVVKGLSNDGQWMLYLNIGSNHVDAFVANTTTGNSIALPVAEGEFVSDGTLSGNGSIAFLAISTGRIVSADAQSGAGMRTIVAAPAWMPTIGSGPAYLFPGSIVHLTGKNLPSAATAFAGRMFLDNIALPIVYANHTEVVAQVPWELAAPGSSAFRLESDSPFRQNQWVPILPMLPQFQPLDPNEASVLGFKAIRGDFSGLLTSQPSPGEVFVVYMTGMGPVNGPMVTGEPAPVDRAISIQGQFACSFHPYGVAETLFAGLAPGLLGVYQVNFRIPPGSFAGPITGGTCTYSGGGRDGGFSWSVPRPKGPF
jgi:uncharacterized protein (TIGR03437 family)